MKKIKKQNAGAVRIFLTAVLLFIVAVLRLQINWPNRATMSSTLTVASWLGNSLRSQL